MSTIKTPRRIIFGLLSAGIMALLLSCGGGGGSGGGSMSMRQALLGLIDGLVQKRSQGVGSQESVARSQ